MIEFSKDIDANAAKALAEKRAAKSNTVAYNTKKTEDDASFLKNNGAAMPLQMGNDMLGAVVAEEDKIEKPKKADVSKFEKSKQLGDFSNDNNNGADKVLSVPEI